MWLIVNESGINYTITEENGLVKVLAISKDGAIRTEGRTRKEAVVKAHRELKKMAEDFSEGAE
jgi:hypothetical protein